MIFAKYNEFHGCIDEYTIADLYTEVLMTLFYSFLQSLCYYFQNHCVIFQNFRHKSHNQCSLAFGIKISPHHHTPFTTPRDWHGFTSASLIAGLICIERWSHGKYPMPRMVCDDVGIF